MAQLAGLVMLDPENVEAKGLFFFGGIEGCRFRKPVVPGDVLVSCLQNHIEKRLSTTSILLKCLLSSCHQMMRTEVTKFNKRFGIVKVDAKGYVGTDLVVEAELTLAMAKQ